MFAEQRSFAVQHVFIPAAIFFYLQDIFKFLTVIYLFESFEYLFGQLDEEWQEEPGDSLVGDILMGVVGMLAAMRFKMTPKPLWYAALHVGTLAACSVVTVNVLGDEITWSYVLFALVATIMATLISREWALFSAINMVAIAAIATRGFTREFSHTPVATLISLGTTYGVYSAYVLSQNAA